MFFFMAYGLIVWYAAALHRRRWRGFAIVLGALVGLFVIGYVHWLAARWTNGAIFLPALQAMLYPYAALVGLMGFYICCVPRRRVHGLCRGCDYDLSGLDGEEVRCPECGNVQRAVEPLPAEKPVQQAHQEREDRQAGDEAPLGQQRLRARHLLHHGKHAGGGALGDRVILVREPGDRRLE